MRLEVGVIALVGIDERAEVEVALSLQCRRPILARSAATVRDWTVDVAPSRAMVDALKSITSG